MCLCCETIDIKTPGMNINTALDANLDDDYYQAKRKSRDEKLANIACEINLFNDKQRTYKYDINKLFSDSNGGNEIRNVSLDIPRIVVVGTQTSGKSSLVNRIINMDLLPTGNMMVTRSPIYIEIKKCDSNTIPYISLSCIDEGREILFFTEKIQLLLKEKFKDKINELTYKLTGNDSSITKSPIVIKIYRPDVTPIFLVDLPGIFLINKTGQKSNTASEVDSLIKEQLSIPNTYAIVAMESKLDLETDLGLGSVKKIQEERSDLKAFGILTKPDLLDPKNVSQFDKLIGDDIIDKSLSTDLGFFVINNNFDDVNWYTSFFGKDSSIVKNKKYGARNFLLTYRKKINASILSEVPVVKNSLGLLRKQLITLCPQLGEEIKEPHEKQLFINYNLNVLSSLITNSIKSRGNKYNIGPQIKIIIETMFTEINNLTPFSESKMSDEELKRIINSFDGFTESSQSKKALIISRCLENKEGEPVGNIIKKIKTTTGNIKKSIYELCKMLLEEKKLDSQLRGNTSYYSFQIREFPTLKDFIIKTIAKVLDKYEKEALENIERSLIIQEPRRRVLLNSENFTSNVLLIGKQNSFDSDLESSYSDDKKKPLLGVSGTNGISIFDIYEKEQVLSVREIRNLLILSFEQISKIAKENALKAIDSIQIEKFQIEFINETFSEFREYYKKYTIDTLFSESDENMERNKVFVEFISDIDRIIDLIKKLDD
jgi:GTP-binding protein EngB required for normal cell division